MCFTARYSPVCDNLKIYFNYLSKANSDSQLEIYYTLEGSDPDNFTSSNSNRYYSQFLKDENAIITFNLKLPVNSKLQTLKFVFKSNQPQGEFEFSNLKIGKNDIKNLISNEDIKYSSETNSENITGNIDDGFKIKTFKSDSADDTFLTITKPLLVGGNSSSLNLNNILSILVFGVLTFLISGQFYQLVFSKKEKENNNEKVVVHYKTRNFMNVEILRFMLVMFVVMEHLSNLFFDNHSILSNNYLFFNNFIYSGRSQLFFVIAGFFLFYSSKNLQNSVLFFIKKRWLRMSSLVIFTTILAYAMHGFKTDVYPLEQNILTSLLANWITDMDGYLIAPAWYVNSLFFLSCIYFVIFKIFDKKYALFITLIVSAVAVNLYARQIGFGESRVWKNLPGAAFSLSIGILIAELYKLLKSQKETTVSDSKISKKEYLAYSITELFLFIVLIIGLYCSRIGFNLGNNILSGSIALLLWFFILNKGFVSRFFNKSWAIYFGKYTFSLFLTHWIILSMLPTIMKSHNAFCNEHYIIFPLCCIFVILAFGVACHHLVELPLSKWTAKKFLYKE